MTMASASVSTANRMGASLEAAPADELLYADELHKASSSSLSATPAGQNKNFGKLVGKKAARLKELVLQNLGKADRTQDELFEAYEINFHKQQQQVSKLTKEFKSYVAALRHFHEASRSLNKCIQQSTDDYQSARHDLVCENLSQLEALNEDLLEKLDEEVLKQVSEYLGKFGQMKEKISKRHRKLIDYDKSRRLYELMLAQVNKRRAKQNQAMSQAAVGSASGNQTESENYHSILRGLKFLSQQQETATSVTSQQEFIASQLVDEARLLKFREQFNYSKLMYENINGELHDELPIVYEKKMKSLLAALQSYFALESHYHSNAAKLVASVCEVIDKMPNCVGMQQAGIAARKLDAGLDCNNNQGDTILDGEDEDEDNDDDEFYESGSSSDSPAGQSRAGGPVDDKVRQLDGNAGGSSSGLGSSRGDSSSSMGSSSPEYSGKQEISMDPAVEQRADQPECSESGKGEQPAEFSVGAAVAAAQVEVPSAVGMDQPEVGSVGAVEAMTVSESECVDGIEAKAVTVVDMPLVDAVGMVADEMKEIAAISTAKTANVLYKVRTNYKYLAEDVDELCFEPDEIIQVVEFEQHQEPEEGWLMGIRETNGQRGLFPANFTQPI